MEFENWEHIKDINHILYFGALATAIIAMYSLYALFAPKIKYAYGKLKWIMSEENDHAIIMERLDAIAGKLERNGGSHIPDSLDRIEEHVKFLGARQQAALHMRPNPVFETDSKGEIVFINAMYKRAFGIDGAEASGMGWVNVIAPTNREEVIEKWFRAVNDKRTFDEYMDLLDPEGNTIKCHVVAYVIRGDDSVLGHHGEVIILEKK